MISITRSPDREITRSLLHLRREPRLASSCPLVTKCFSLLHIQCFCIDWTQSGTYDSRILAPLRVLRSCIRYSSGYERELMNWVLPVLFWAINREDVDRGRKILD